MKNVSKQKQIKLWNEQNCMESTEEIMQHVLKIQKITSLPKYMKWVSRLVFLHVFTFAIVVFENINMLLCLVSFEVYFTECSVVPAVSIMSC